MRYLTRVKANVQSYLHAKCHISEHVPIEVDRGVFEHRAALSGTRQDQLFGDLLSQFWREQMRGLDDTQVPLSIV
jgi:hypothetical protein